MDRRTPKRDQTGRDNAISEIKVSNWGNVTRGVEGVSDGRRKVRLLELKDTIGSRQRFQSPEIEWYNFPPLHCLAGTAGGMWTTLICPPLKSVNVFYTVTLTSTLCWAHCKLPINGFKKFRWLSHDPKMSQNIRIWRHTESPTFSFERWGNRLRSHKHVVTSQWSNFRVWTPP